MHDLWQHKRNKVYTKDNTGPCNTLENIKHILKNTEKIQRLQSTKAASPLATMLESVPKRPSLRNSENRDNQTFRSVDSVSYCLPKSIRGSSKIGLCCLYPHFIKITPFLRCPTPHHKQVHGLTQNHFHKQV